MALTHDDFATLEVQKAVFHDLPQQARLRDERAVPVLSEAETPLTNNSRAYIRNKLVDTLRSTRAYPVRLREGGGLVANSVREYLSRNRQETADFIARSRILGEHLFSLQTSSMSAGLLCVVACTVNRRRSIGLMKVEREEGAQLELSGQAGHQTFTFEMLDNLVFTKNTKLYKAALFAKIGPSDDSIAATASDDQLGSMAKYWLDFLVCDKERDARVDTEGFFKTVLRSVNRASDLSVIEKHDTYEALLTEMRSNRGSVNVSRFILEHIPPQLRDDLRREIRATGILTTFDKDTSDIQASIKRTVLHTRRQIKVVIPAQLGNLVSVEDEMVTINDPLEHVGSES
jgi:37-kD nucleoid-associated bacterial protein